MKTVDYITAGGKPTHCAAPVVHWREHGRTWIGKKPRQLTELLVCHWAGGEGDLNTFYNTCLKGDVSAHFWIDADERTDGFATIYQLADADKLLAHCKGANLRAVGIEARNRGNLPPVRGGAPNKIKREVLRETINGREVVYCAFLPSQVRSFIALNIALCEAYGLPLAVPMEEVTRNDAAYPLPPMRVIPRQLSQSEFAEFRGVIGHLHWSPDKQKVDPGLALMTALAVAFEPKTAPDREGHLREIGGMA